MATYPEYIKAALRRAHYEQMEKGEWFASIPGFEGLWASGPLIEETRERLSETRYEWIPVHARIGKNRLPDVDGMAGGLRLRSAVDAETPRGLASRRFRQGAQRKGAA
ncbi:MAG TPA: hypothetical protein VGX03_29935 [Candidatus Binatia bacterium]|nr:hypothetical protein [Candidatus Binatia bacterium]